MKKVYVVIWFAIKGNTKFTKGPLHLYKMITLVNLQLTEIQKICKKVIQNNCYFAHPENVLPAMLEDGDENIRRIAMNKILEVRGRKEKVIKSKRAKGNRWFKTPELIWEATSYVNMFDWESTVITQPAVTVKMTEDLL